MANATDAPSTRGRVLNRVVTVIAHDGRQSKEYFEDRIFITSAKVSFPPADEKDSPTMGPFVGVWIDAPDYQRTFLMVPGELRHVAARLKPGRFYGFEGTIPQDRNNRRTRFVTVTGITNQTVTVYDKPEVETEEDVQAEDPLFVS